MAYNAGASSGSNQGPLNPALNDAVKARIEALRAADPGNTAPVPVDLVTASAAGSIRTSARRGAATRSARVARVRRPAGRAGRAAGRAHTEGRWLGVLGEPRVNVLALNLALDRALRMTPHIERCP